MRSIAFWGKEALLVVLFFLFAWTDRAWVMWRDGDRITGPIVKVTEFDNVVRVTVRDPATELAYTARMPGHDQSDVGTTATVIVHPIDRSRVTTLRRIYRDLATQCVLLAMTIAHPIWAVVVHRRSRVVRPSRVPQPGW